MLKSLFAFAVSVLVAGSALAQGLVKTDTVVGKGKEAVTGSTVVVNYTGWLHDPKAEKQRGKQFDSSIGRAGRFPSLWGRDALSAAGTRAWRA